MHPTHQADPEGLVREIGFDAFLLQHCVQIEQVGAHAQHNDSGTQSPALARRQCYTRAKVVSLQRQQFLFQCIDIYDLVGILTGANRPHCRLRLVVRA